MNQPVEIFFLQACHVSPTHKETEKKVGGPWPLNILLNEDDKNRKTHTK